MFFICPDCAPTPKVTDELAPNALAESAKQITCFEASDFTFTLACCFHQYCIMYV